MKRSGFWIWIELIGCLVASAGAAGDPAVIHGATGVLPAAGTAFAIVDLNTGATLVSANAAQLDRAVAPGSAVKFATLIALLESNTIDQTTRIACTRQVAIGGRQYPCSHPDLHRPLNAAEALAHSCNSFFATTATRLPRRALDAAFVSLGLPPPPARLDTRQAALGLEGVTATPRQLLEALRRVATDSRLAIRDDTRRTVIEGLRGAAQFGTASPLGAAGVDALAKTGSAGGANPHGVVVAVTPASRPAQGIVVLVAGAAGADAAEIAAQELKKLAQPRAGPPPVTLPRVDSPKTASSAVLSTGLPERIRVGFARPNGGYDVQTLDFEDYVARVLAGEAAVRSPDAALDALAIAIRTFAAANPRRHNRDGFEVCDLTHCQVVRPPTDRTRSAAERTRGRVLLYQGAPASVYYTASCGGRSELASAVWLGHDDPPFLPSRRDPACADAAEWQADVPVRDLLRALKAAGFKGDALRDLKIRSRTSSDRAGVLQISGLTPSTLTGQDLRVAVGRTLGWHLIKSAAFDVSRTATGYRFTGRGSGHGVGLCVLGSVRMASDGAAADAILAAYFPGLSSTTAATIATGPPPPPNVSVMLPAAEEGQRAMIENLAQHIWTRVRGRAAIDTATGATLRFHPTVESYRRATGQPWWVSATTRGSETQLLPATVLRSRGILEQTIAHEIAHIVTSGVLDGRPLWVKEGAAMYFAGESFGPTPAKTKCPDDAEISRAPSAGALREAYARAASCFALRVEAGENWKTIK
jgi:stage II sporulation protein D (peptidoglycan lytic transglycosylase)